MICPKPELSRNRTTCARSWRRQGSSGSPTWLTSRTEPNVAELLSHHRLPAKVRSRRWERIARQDHREGRSLPRFAGDIHHAAEALDDLLDDPQPKTEPAILSFGNRALETLEDAA